METQPSPAAAPVKLPNRWNLFRRLAENPVILKELRGRMRGKRAFLLLTGYLSLIGLVIGITYISLALNASYSYSLWDPGFRQSIGKIIFSTVVMMELFVVSLIGPALTSGAITSERERQTFDLLCTTTLSARSFVLGKLGSALAYLLLLIFAALPIESIAFLLGGVGLEEILVSGLMLVVTAVFYCALGLFFSSFMKRTAGASVSSYVTIVLSYVLLGVVFFIVLTIAANMMPMSTGNLTNYSWENFLMILALLLTSANPLLAAVVSEYALVNNQSIFILSTPLSGGSTIGLPSPWILFTVFHILLALLLISLSIFFVRRPDR